MIGCLAFSEKGLVIVFGCYYTIGSLGRRSDSVVDIIRTTVHFNAREYFSYKQRFSEN
jgi:hypothetical protein